LQATSAKAGTLAMANTPPATTPSNALFKSVDFIPVIDPLHFGFFPPGL
jgi:hypothetical protein